ncbi:MAG: hypothetical protein ACUVTL_04155 [Thermoproteota archaeon]
MENERKRKLSGIIDLISFGVLLIVLGFIWSKNTNLPYRAIAFFKSIGQYRNLPPYSAFKDVYEAFIVFVYMLAAWSFLLAAIKIPLGLGVSNALSSALGGIFLLALGYFVREYLRGTFSVASMIGIFLILVGIFIIISGVASEAWRRKTH